VCESVCVYVIQYAKHMRSTMLPSVAYRHYIFPHYLINGTIFGKHLLNIKYVLGFSQQTSSETVLVLRIIQ
jgi:hypothetical protein